MTAYTLRSICEYNMIVVFVHARVAPSQVQSLFTEGKEREGAVSCTAILGCACTCRSIEVTCSPAARSLACLKDYMHFRKVYVKILYFTRVLLLLLIFNLLKNTEI